MKRTLVYLMVLASFIAACSVPGGPVSVPTEVPPTSAPTEAPTDAPDPAETPDAGDPTAAQQAVLEVLAGLLGVDVADLAVLATEAVEWNDSCLGVVRINAICAQGVVPGYNIKVDADGLVFEIHTNLDGTAWTLAPVSAGPEAEAAEQVARAALMKALGLQDYEIMTVSSNAVEWSNACLGVEVPGMGCAEVITPGYAIVLESNGVLYKYHTNQDGTAVQPASLALTWEREGGIAGFCDALRVYRSGEVLLLRCNDGEVVGEGTLAETVSQEEVAQFVQWLAELGQVTIAQSDGAVADSMSIDLEFAGAGSGVADEAQKQALLDWAQNVFNQFPQS